MKNKFWNDWEIVDKISEGGFGVVYKAKRNDGSLCAIKHVSLPKEDKEIDVLIKNGVIRNYEDANNYYINTIKNEIEIMKRFNGNPYIVDCYDLYQENKDDGVGIDFYIRMEYVEDLKTYCSNNPMDANDVVKLGIDICNALELCSSINIIHNDIKPGNIFVGNDGKFKLGDFGVATNTGIVDKTKFGTLNYISPEVYDGKGANNSTDLYSLGLVMYKLLDGDLPFVSNSVKEEDAFKTRMSGRKIPSIRGLNKKLMDVLEKACSFNSSQRFNNATEMKRELEKIPRLNSNKKRVSFVSNKSESTIGIYERDLSSGGTFGGKNVRSVIPNKMSLKTIIGGVVVIALVIFLGGIYAFNRGCDAGYINKNGKCVRGYYYCNAEYVLNGNNECQKTIESVEAKVSYTCPNDYVLNNDKCVSEDVVEPTFKYMCADGFSLNNKTNKCTKTESVDAELVYTCSDGSPLVGGKCVGTVKDASAKYVCKDLTYSLSGTSCVKNVTKTVGAEKKYYCDSNGVLNGTVCDYTVSPNYSGIWWGGGSSCSRGTYNYNDRMCHYTESAKFNYVCSEGTSNGAGGCVITTRDTKSADVEYSCPSGYEVVGNQCIEEAAVSSKYVCSDNTVLKGSKCYATVTTDAVAAYTCPEGFIVAGVTCVQNDFPTPIKKYSCSRVYTLNGDKCEKYEKTGAKAHYYEDE